MRRNVIHVGARAHASRSCCLFLFSLSSLLLPLVAQLAAVAADPTLASLSTSITEATLMPSFSPSTYAYTQSISSSRTSFSATATVDCSPSPASACSLVATWNGGAETRLQSGVETTLYTIDTNSALNELLLTIVSSTSSNVTYVLDLVSTSVAGYNANLLGFTLLQLNEFDGGAKAFTPTMTPSTFSSQVMLYQLQMPQGVNEFAIVLFMDTMATALLTVTHAPNASAVAAGFNPTTSALLHNNETSSLISIDQGEQVRLELNITAMDGATKKSYTLLVNRFGETAAAPSSSTGDSSLSQGERSSTGTIVLSQATALSPAILAFLCLCIVQLVARAALL